MGAHSSVALDRCGGQCWFAEVDIHVNGFAYGKFLGPIFVAVFSEVQGELFALVARICGYAFVYLFAGLVDMVIDAHMPFAGLCFLGGGHSLRGCVG